MANPKMQRAHFQLIADCLDDIKVNVALEPDDKAVVARVFADRLRSTNPNFNRDRFLEACGVQDA